MTTITTRSGKGSPLTNNEVDANFTNLNDDKVEASGDSMTGNLSFGDNNKAIFGAGSDLQIYHDGSDSVIQDFGTGDLKLIANEFKLYEGNGTDLMIGATPNGAVTLSHNASTKLATTSTGIDVTGVITTDGMTTSADINFGDNDKAVFGAGSDLQIYHNGTGSYIEENGTGNLFIEATNLRLKSASGENYIAADQDGAVIAFYDNTARLATTSTGIDVTGTVTADGLTVNASTSQMITLNHSTPSNFTTIGQDSSGDFRVRSDNLNKLKSYANGDFALYEDTGTTAKLFWDASAESLGIGTSSPDTLLHLSHATGSAVLRLERNDTAILATDQYGAIEFEGQDANAGASGVRASMRAIAEASVGQTSLTFSTAGSSASEAERMRIDSSGQVGIGTSSPARQFHLHDSSASYLHLTNGTTGSTANDGASISMAGTSLQISNRENGVLQMYTNGSERMRIDASGLVGIGTSSPEETLSVMGDFQVALNTSVTGRGLKVSTSNTSITDDTVSINAQASTGILAFQTNSSERMRIDSSGNVEIGTQATGSASSKQLLSLVNPLGNTGAGARLWLSGTNATTRGAYIEGQAQSTGNDHDLIFATSASGTTPAERMRIESSGNVGIGTSSPAAPLDVAYADNANIFRASYASSEDNFFLELDSAILTGGVVGYQFHLKNNGTSYNNMLTFDRGNIGIGTSNPSHPLTVDTGAGTFSVRAKGGSSVTLASDASMTYFADTHEFSNAAGTTEYGRFDSSGNLLVGKTGTSVADTGVQWLPNGNSAITRSSGIALFLNRTSSDGSIVDFRKDNTSVGSIGNNTDFYIASQDGVGLRFTNNQVLPCSESGAIQNGSRDLGSSSARFKDLHLAGDVIAPNIVVSNGVFLGGTSNANKLDDYEVGTWTPVASGTWTTTPTNLAGRYIKVGNFVWIEAKMTGGAKASTVSGYLTGLPFSTNNSFGGTGSVVDSAVVEHGSCLFQNTDRIWLTDTAFGTGTVYITGGYEIA